MLNRNGKYQYVNNANNNRVHRALAYDLYRREEYSAALVEFSKCGKPTASLLLDKAKCHSRLGNHSEVISIASQAVALLKFISNNDIAKQQKTKKLFLLLANSNSALFKRTGDKYYLQQQKIAIDNHPDHNDPELLRTLGWYYLDLNEFDKAFQIIERLLKENPNDKILARSTVILQTKIREKYFNTRTTLTKEEAVSLLADIKSDTNKEGNLAILLKISCEFPELINLNEITIIPGGCRDKELKIAMLYFNTHKTLEAESIYNNLIKENPQLWEARIRYAYLLFNRNEDLEGAITILLPLIDANAQPKPTDEQLFKTYRLLAMVYKDINNIPQSKKYTEEGLRINPNDPALLSIRAKLTNDLSTKPSNKTFHYYEQARTFNTKRFNTNHPLPENSESKVILDESHSNQTSTAFMKKIIPSAPTSKSGPQSFASTQEIKPQQTHSATIPKHTPKKRKQKSVEAPISYDNLIKVVPSLMTQKPISSCAYRKNEPLIELSGNRQTKKQPKTKSTTQTAAHPRTKANNASLVGTDTAALVVANNKPSIKTDELNQEAQLNPIKSDNTKTTSRWCNLFTKPVVIVASTVAVVVAAVTYGIS